MTLSPLLLGLLWQACLTTSLHHDQAPCAPSLHLTAPLPTRFIPGAFTPSGERRYGPEEFPLRLYYVGEPPEGLTRDAVERAMKGAIEAWNDVPCSGASMRYEGRVGTLDQVPDGAFPVLHLEESASSCLRRGEVSRIGAAPCFIGDRDLFGAVFNRDAMRWYALGTSGQVRTWEPEQRPWIDFRSALTHELGHLLGLNHPSEEEQTPRATMFASYRVDGGQSRLAATDRAHLCALYPDTNATTQTCRTDRHCVSTLDDPGARCVDLGVWRVCDKESGETGDYCADNLLYCEDLCLITSSESRTGFCTMRCQSDGECAEGWECDAQGTLDVDPSRRAICRPVGEQEAPSGCQLAPGAKRKAPPIGFIVLCGVWGAWRRRRLRRS